MNLLAKRRLLALAAAATLLGLWTSLQYSLASWFVDADEANPAMLWQGVHQYGWGFLRSFRYTQDNWLLSLILPLFGVFALVGANPLFVIVTGWLIFVGCVALCAWLAAHLSNARAFAIVPPLLLLCTWRALGDTGGSYSEPVTHNVSMLWGLAALLLAMRWLDHGRLPTLVAATLALFVAALSDPWTDPAFTLPALLAALALAIRHRAARARGLALAGAIAVATVLAMTRCVGLLGFLPQSDPAWGSLATLPEGLGLFAHMLPALFTLPLLDPASPAAIVSTGSLVALALAAGGFAWVRAAAALAPAQRFAVLALYLSLAGTAAASCLSQLPTQQTAARFIMNWGLVLPALTTAACLRGRLGRPLCSGFATLSLLLVVAGLLSGPRIWLRGLPTPATDHFQQVANLLQRSGLHYGYGDYWGSSPTAITWISRSAVRIRPLQLDPATGHAAAWPYQVSPLWFQPADRPPGEQSSFVLLWNDCPNRPLCIAGLSEQFGPPSRVIVAGTVTVVVWPHPLPVALAN